MKFSFIFVVTISSLITNFGYANTEACKADLQKRQVLQSTSNIELAFYDEEQASALCALNPISEPGFIQECETLAQDTISSPTFENILTFCIERLERHNKNQK